MGYNTDYINLKHTLIEIFLIPLDKGVLDISYRVINDQIDIQVVVLKGYTLSKELKNKISKKLPTYTIKVAEIYLTRDQFNESRGEWNPKYYNWLDNLLFSKAEI